MKISKYNMPWGVLVAQHAGDMHCAVIFNLARELFRILNPLLASLLSLRATTQTTPAIYHLIYNSGTNRCFLSFLMYVVVFGQVLYIDSSQQWR